MEHLFDPPGFLVPGSEDLTCIRKGSDHVLNLLVIFKELDRKVTSGVLATDVLILLDQCLDAVDAPFEFLAVIDVDVASQPLVMLLVDLDHRVQQLRDPGSVTADCRADRHSEKVAELLDVEFVSPRLKLVIHIQSHDDTKVHVDDLCGQVEVPFDVGCVNHIHDNVWDILHQILADVEFLRAVG